VTRWLWIYPQQQQLAMEHQEKELVSIQNAIRTFHDNLTYLAEDYSILPEIQELVEDTSTADIELGKQEFDLARHELQYFAIADTSNTILFGLYRSDDNTAINEISEEQKALFTARLENINSTQVIESFELFRGNPVMAVAYPIFNDSANEKVIGRLLISWKLYGPSLQQISDIIQLDIQPSSEKEIRQSEKINLYQLGLKAISDKHVRCLYDKSNTLVNCLTIYHDKHLIPHFLNFRILARLLAFSLIPLIFFIIMLNYLIRPLEQSTKFLKSTSSSKGIKHLTEQAPILEIEELRIAFNELVDMTHEQKNLLELQSMTDALTQIPNRRAFNEEINKTQNRLNRHGGTAAIIMCDIDYFKRFNDHYGHLHGDEVLKKVANNLHQFGRRTDEICARYGGEEFTIILSNLTLEELIDILTAINNSITDLNEPHEYSPHHQLTLSCGAIFIDCPAQVINSESAAQWIDKADKALYLAKDAGRNRYEIYTPPSTKS
jgi:diguanylate cyclase (GGDEF)-like protein